MLNPLAQLDRPPTQVDTHYLHLLPSVHLPTYMRMDGHCTRAIGESVLTYLSQTPVARRSTMECCTATGITSLQDVTSLKSWASDSLSTAPSALGQSSPRPEL
jgi:hypothetical protein